MSGPRSVLCFLFARSLHAGEHVVERSEGPGKTITAGQGEILFEEDGVMVRARSTLSPVLPGADARTLLVARSTPIPRILKGGSNWKFPRRLRQHRLLRACGPPCLCLERGKCWGWLGKESGG
jgi:hypothetical protein